MIFPLGVKALIVKTSNQFSLSLTVRIQKWQIAKHVLKYKFYLNVLQLLGYTIFICSCNILYVTQSSSW